VFGTILLPTGDPQLLGAPLDRFIIKEKISLLCMVRLLVQVKRGIHGPIEKEL
jgi:hypothetical protein